MNKRILDYEGAVKSSDMRKLFERIANDTPQFREALDITPELSNGEFSGYQDDQTNTLWVGFAIGIRCAARISDSQGGKRRRGR